MAFQYNPNDASSCQPKGEYEALLEKITEEPSKRSGKMMYVVTLRVYGDRESLVTDYITHEPSMTWKVKRYAKALNQEAAFDSGEFELLDWEGNTLIAELDVEKQDEYDDKNRVKGLKPKPGASIVKRESSHVPATTGGTAPGAPNDPGKHVPVSEDDIPF